MGGGAIPVVSKLFLHHLELSLWLMSLILKLAGLFL
jgi:hypothetical protein